MDEMNQTMSTEIDELAAALAKAQANVMDARADKSNPFYKSKYADLASVWNACREALTSNNLAVVQTTNGSDGNVKVITTLVHSSGQWIRGELNMKPVKNDPQGIGSCITYGRRYSLAAMVGVAVEDDDANSASGKNSHTNVKTITEKQAQELRQDLEETGSDIKGFLKHFKVESISELTQTQHTQAKQIIKAKQEKILSEVQVANS